MLAMAGLRAYPPETMLRVCLIQDWSPLSDPAMEDAQFEMPPLPQFACPPSLEVVPEETTTAVRAAKQR
jgi:IS5 family transposase